MSSARVAVCGMALSLSLSVAVFGDELLTFEDGKLTDLFDALPNSNVVGWTPESNVDSSRPRPSGRAVRLSAPARGGFVTKGAFIGNTDWRQVKSLGLWLHRTADEAREHPSIELEIRLIEQDRQAHFWRRLEVAHIGWQQVVLPLDWFVWSQDRIPRWGHVRYLGFSLRDAGSVTIDTVWTEPANEERDEFLDAADIGHIAFPPPTAVTEPPRSRTLETRDVQLLTNASTLDLEQLAAHLKLAAGLVRSELPFLAEPNRGPVLIVFQSADEYRQFIPLLARRFSLRIDPPDSDGYTLEGISLSAWNDKFGTLRPVYVHEFLHGYLSRTARLPLQGDWLHEGLATHFQLRLHPQDDLPQIIAAGLSSQKSLPLNELCDGRRISTSRYWQAATLCQLLLSEPKYRRQLTKFFERLSTANSVDLGPHLKPVWETDWTQLTADWRKHCKAIVDKKPMHSQP